MVLLYFWQQSYNIDVWSKYWKDKIFFDVKNVVFELFSFYIGIKEKCHVYSFVEQVELYRLVYNSIRSIDNFRGEKSRLWIQCCTWKGVSAWHSHLIISPWERFERMSNTPFDVEFNGLQNDISFFLAIDFWPRYLVKILKKARLLICEKNTVFELFRFYIEVEEKSLIYSFVEQVKLYRLVYDSIS